MAGHRFVLVGGDPALDFLNTIHDWTAAEPRDYLADLGEALRFAEASGVLSPAERRALSRHPGANELDRLRELRARLERVFRARVRRRAPSPEDLALLARDAADAAAAAHLRSRADGLARVVDAGGPATVRLRLADAALALLTSRRLTRLKACPGCGWFFLDGTKNGSRRWCSMAMCGNPAKARAYYRRHRAGARPGGVDSRAPRSSSG